MKTYLISLIVIGLGLLNSVYAQETRPTDAAVDSLTDAERTAIADTIERLSRERPDNAARSVDCDELARRGRAALPAGLQGRNTPDFSIVSQGRIFGSSSNEELAEIVPVEPERQRGAAVDTG